MRIQPICIQNNHSQPAFRAAFSNDSETRENLKKLLNEDGTNPEYIYCLLQNLKMIDSNDTLSLKIEDKGVTKLEPSDDKIHNNLLFTVTNTKTGASTYFNQYLNLFSGMMHIYISDKGAITHCDYPQSRAGEAMYRTILCNDGLRKLFGIQNSETSDFIAPESCDLESKIDVADINNKIDQLGQDISSLLSQKEQLNVTISNKNREKESLLEQKQGKKVQYVSSQIDMMA